MLFEDAASLSTLIPTLLTEWNIEPTRENSFRISGWLAVSNKNYLNCGCFQRFNPLIGYLCWCRRSQQVIPVQILDRRSRNDRWKNQGYQRVRNVIWGVNRRWTWWSQNTLDMWDHYAFFTRQNISLIRFRLNQLIISRKMISSRVYPQIWIRWRDFEFRSHRIIG